MKTKEEIMKMITTLYNIVEEHENIGVVEAGGRNYAIDALMWVVGLTTDENFITNDSVGYFKILKYIDSVVKRETDKMKMIGREIAWEFKNKIYKNLEEFRTAVVEYNEEFNNEIKDSVLDNICVDYSTFEINYDNQYFDEHIHVTFIADNKKNFTTKEILWRLNNWIAKNKPLNHHIYFEGLSPDGKLYLGS